MERGFCAALRLLILKVVQRDIPSGVQGKRRGEVMRESEKFSGRIKDEQKGGVFERGRSLRKVVNYQKCIPNTCFTP